MVLQFIVPVPFKDRIKLLFRGHIAMTVSAKAKEIKRVEAAIISKPKVGTYQSG